MRFLNIFRSVSFLISIVLHTCYSMECYVCKNEYENLDKCLNSVDYCKPEEDMCLSEISWKLPPHWVSEPTRHYGLSKSCATSAKCESLKYRTRFNCTYNSYEDWNCVECCEGSQCNYYINMKGSAVESNSLLLIGCIATFIGFYVTNN